MVPESDSNASCPCLERPLVFAHRGGSKLAPENTMAAFDAGMAAGADGFELDVHLSRDGVVVVHHDRRLDRTTRATGLVRDRIGRGAGIVRRARAARRAGAPFARENYHRAERTWRRSGGAVIGKCAGRTR